MNKKKAVVLLSGGLDSSTILAFAKSKEFELYALSFDYGQRHNHELDAAKKIAQAFGVKDHKVITIDLRAFGGSALTAELDVPKGKDSVVCVSFASFTIVKSICFTGWDFVPSKSIDSVGISFKRW